MRWLNWRALAAVAAVSGMACGASLAVAEETEEEGRIGKIVRIGKDLLNEDEEEVVVIEQNVRAAEQAPTFWIGMSGRGVENPVLRTHLQLAEDMGVVVETVVEGSPAAEAGLRRHDILLRANGEAVHNMRVLRDLVSQGNGQPIELELIRLGKKITLEVTPVAKPADASAFSGRRRGRMVFGNDEREVMRKMLKQFGEPGALDRFGGMGALEGFGDFRGFDAGRVFGPGVVGNAAPDLGGLDGVAFSVRKQGNQPAEVTVSRDGETWTVQEGDEAALAEMPEELQPHVRRMLGGAAGPGVMRFDFGGMPWQNGAGWAPWGNNPGESRRIEEAEEDAVIERMEAIERRLEELQERLGEE
ncbi:MAG: PDZ domain-containing protein [Planctomycetota bacterium]